MPDNSAQGVTKAQAALPAQNGSWNSARASLPQQANIHPTALPFILRDKTSHVPSGAVKLESNSSKNHLATGLVHIKHQILYSVSKEMAESEASSGDKGHGKVKGIM